MENIVSTKHYNISTVKYAFDKYIYIFYEIKKKYDPVQSL